MSLMLYYFILWIYFSLGWVVNYLTCVQITFEKGFSWCLVCKTCSPSASDNTLEAFWFALFWFSWIIFHLYFVIWLQGIIRSVNPQFYVFYVCPCNGKSRHRIQLWKKPLVVSKTQMEKIGQHVKSCGVKTEAWLITVHPMGQCLNGHAVSGA